MNRLDSSTARTTPPSDQGVLARRVADRQHHLDLTDEALARRAGMTPAYLRLLMTAGAGFDPAGLLRLGAAMDLTYRELTEGPDDPPPGQGPPVVHPVLIHLTAQECWDRLGSGGVGRIALAAEPGPTVLPVNYTVRSGSVLYRTAPHGAAAPRPGTVVSFQVDRIDDSTSTGWSVLLTGPARPVEDPAEIQDLESQPGAEPWAGGNRPQWVRIRPDTLTGRRIGTVTPGDHLH
ncbi:pyridoxamine 5'-phosphate oxidase family protein [Kitasatospora sp. NPDC002040]|uniref:pyridoxamine 5'-phosphate oxidase family protein n=1 Tax=Kitasatospora sp. NPDC002040 TaxID=3154661 RepID=UPI00331FB232